VTIRIEAPGVVQTSVKNIKAESVEKAMEVAVRGCS
jgi:hypothetical protein